MHQIRRSLVIVVPALALSGLAVSCARGDIILGNGGGASAGRDVIAAGSGAGDAASPEATAGASGQSAAAGSAGDTIGSAGASGMSAGAAAPAPAGTGGVGADAGPPRTVARPSAGCGKEPNLGETSVSVYGQRATYVVELPGGYDKARAYPLVLTFHGSNVTAAEFRDALNLRSITGADAILVHANTLNDAPAWEFSRDMPVFDVLLPKLKDDYCIDEDRVFALGEGAGSLFVNLIGCVNADDVRAIALLTGAPPPPGPCAGNTAVWIAQDNGDPAQLGPGRGNRDFWAVRNGCDIPVSASTCFEYSGCDAGHPVHYCEYESGRSVTSALPAVWSLFQGL